LRHISAIVFFFAIIEPMRKQILLVLSLFALPCTSFAWGKEGHEVIARIAADHLTPRARLEVQRLLSLEPGATLPSIANWADLHKNSTTAKWHYVNFPRGKKPRYSSAVCPDDVCLVTAIDKEERMLGDRRAPLARREQALKYVVHLIGDAHQPLHAGFPDDRGGNLYQVRWNGRGTNLHHVWDTSMIESLDLTPAALAQEIETTEKVSGGGSPARWVEESAQIVASPGFYPPRQVSASYAERWKPTVECRLMQAGLRLAEVLNRSLD
jgi:hypothetical protein